MSMKLYSVVLLLFVLACSNSLNLNENRNRSHIRPHHRNHSSPHHRNHSRPHHRDHSRHHSNHTFTMEFFEEKFGGIADKFHELMQEAENKFNSTNLEEVNPREALHYVEQMHRRFMPLLMQGGKLFYYFQQAQNSSNFDEERVHRLNEKFKDLGEEIQAFAEEGQEIFEELSKRLDGREQREWKRKPHFEERENDEQRRHPPMMPQNKTFSIQFFAKRLGMIEHKVHNMISHAHRVFNDTENMNPHEGMRVLRRLGEGFDRLERFGERLYNHFHQVSNHSDFNQTAVEQIEERFQAIAQEAEDFKQEGIDIYNQLKERLENHEDDERRHRRPDGKFGPRRHNGTEENDHHRGLNPPHHGRRPHGKFQPRRHNNTEEDEHDHGRRPHGKFGPRRHHMRHNDEDEHDNGRRPQGKFGPRRHHMRHNHEEH